VDIQTRWRVPTSNTDKTKDGLTDYAASIIDSSYSSMKRDFILDDHKVWVMAPLPKNICYASIDVYATYEVYSRLVNFEKGVDRLHQPVPPKRSRRSQIKN
jgi:hypothetical protein